MTSDIIQDKQTVNSISSVSGSLQGRLELTREQAFLDGTHDIFDILARQHYKQDNWEQSLGKTANLIEHARLTLKNVEKKISEQDKRLKLLEDISGMDPLTRLLNRKGFLKALDREIARTNRGHNDGGLLVMFNLENLDAIQKDHGEQALEMAVRLVARALENEIRDMDLAARIDRDEFVLLFTDTCMSDALGRLQNMALRLNRLSLIWEGAEIRISLSLGLKSYTRGSKPDQIFKDASTDLNRNRKGTVPKKTG